MTYFLKIQNVARSQSRLKVDGWSGLRYIFVWDHKLRVYTYSPKGQNEVDDLFKTMSRTTSYVFAPVENLSANTGAAPVAPVRPKQDESLRENCRQRGILLTDEDTDDTALRLWRAYDKAVADTLTTIPGARRVKKPASRTDE